MIETRREESAVGSQQDERRKRHHFLAQSYMKPWADADVQVAVRRRGHKRRFIANLINVAVESNLYTIDGDSGPDDSLEKSLSKEVDDRLGEIFADLRS